MRYLCTLSLVERAILMVCLYQARVWEIHDQRMLPMWPRPHPLTGHPRATELILPPMRGTLEVAEALGVEKIHPYVKVPIAEGSKEMMYSSFPWVGDLLLFLEDEAGPYCVNLDIKDTPDAFERPAFGRRARGGSARSTADERTTARHAIEKQLYADVGIPTVQLTRADFDEGVVSNLTQLYLWHKRKTMFTEEQRKEIVDNFQAALTTGEPAIEVVFALAARHGWQRDDIKTVLHQAIWRREIRIDLFRGLHIDQPMRREQRDILAVYGYWFKRH
jgi:hypothetical protein